MPYGTVKEVKGNTVIVTMERQDMCGDCHACEMMSGKKDCTLTCQTKIPCNIGDKVEVSLTTDYFLKATYLIYGVPLVGFLIGLFIGIGLSKLLVVSKLLTVGYEDLLIAICIIIGTALGVVYIKVKDKKATYTKFFPHVVSQLE